MAVIESPRLALVHRPGLRSIWQRCTSSFWCWDGGQIVLCRRPNTQLALNVHFIVDLGDAGDGVAQEVDVVHDLQLGAVHVDLGYDVGSAGWRLMHGHRLLRVDDQAEDVAAGGGGGGEEIHSPLHVPFRGGVESAVVGEEKFMVDTRDWKCIRQWLRGWPSVL
ncbi:hypothetical protein SprV_0802538300 [Sparganum proliferum]